MNARLVSMIGALGVLLAGSLVGGGVAFGAEEPYLPGITSNDPNPEGCVSCHKGETSLKKMLATLQHRNVDSKVNIVPDDCASCHKEDEGLDTMAQIAHSMHYAAGSKSDFVSKHQGSCLNCHQLSTGDGAVTAADAGAVLKLAAGLG